MEEYTRQVELLGESIRRWESKKVVVTGDFNVRSIAWGDFNNNRRGGVLGGNYGMTRRGVC